MKVSGPFVAGFDSYGVIIRCYYEHAGGKENSVGFTIGRHVDNGRIKKLNSAAFITMIL